MIYVTHDQEEARSLADRIRSSTRAGSFRWDSSVRVSVTPGNDFRCPAPRLASDVFRTCGKTSSSGEAVLVGTWQAVNGLPRRKREPSPGAEVLVGSRSHSGHNARLDPEQLDLSQTFLFDAATGHLLHAPDAQG